MNIADVILEKARATLPGWKETPATYEDDGWTWIGTGGGYDYVWGKAGNVEVVFADADDAGSPRADAFADYGDHLDVPCDVQIWEGLPAVLEWEEATKQAWVRFDTVREAIEAVAEAWGPDFSIASFHAKHKDKMWGGV